ncbi:MAG: hypothetical protein COT73_01360 [Bdellovibrio sp. CG10_big_fil_rev_8_21_14_0_10_47_8]|nr:MAG: hypothetical protein COT73_01360 [Bdellovibrio sp. CG10_big_fil_rev_8_21_14_0_10_47_8]
MGVEILETASGVLACGEIGWGRLLEPDLILAEIETRLKNSPSASSTLGEIPKTARAAKKILVTAGGTQQPIDQVRHLGNKSTGVTAAGISEVLYEMGFDVIYLQAKGSLSPRTPCEKYSFVTFEDLQQQLRSLLKDIRVDGVVHAAAVADFSVDTIEIDGKTMALNENIKLPTSDTLQLRLKKNPKLVNELRTLAGNSKLPVVAFKMTSHLPVDQARIAIEKVFSESKSNLVIHNDTREIDWDQKKYVYHVYKSKEKIATCENQTELGFQIGNYLMEVDP